MSAGMRRALVIVLDSAGCGHAPDAACYGDAGAESLSRPSRSLPLMALGLAAAPQDGVFADVARMVENHFV